MKVSLSLKFLNVTVDKAEKAATAKRRGKEEDGLTIGLINDAGDLTLNKLAQM